MVLKRIFAIVVLFALVQCSIAIAFQKKLLFHERKLSIDHHFESIYPYTEYMFAREVVDEDTVWMNALYYLPEGDVRGYVFTCTAHWATCRPRRSTCTTSCQGGMRCILMTIVLTEKVQDLLIPNSRCMRMLPGCLTDAWKL